MFCIINYKKNKNAKKIWKQNKTEECIEMIDLNLVKSQNMYIIMIVFCCLTDFLYILTTIQWILVKRYYDALWGIDCLFQNVLEFWAK